MRASSSDVFGTDPVVDRLIALGRSKGSLTFEDLRRNLPIANMSGVEIAEAVARLEEAGIAIDVDDELTAPHSDQSEEFPAGPAGEAIPTAIDPTMRQYHDDPRDAGTRLLVPTRPVAAPSDTRRRSALHVVVAAMLSAATIAALIALAAAFF